MRLAQSAGLIEMPEAATVRGSETAWTALVGAAVAFLRVGTLSLADWADLADFERDAFAEASQIVLAERAAVYGLAAQGTGEALEVGARSDGGATMRRVSLDGMLRSIAASAPTEPAVPVEGAS